MSSALLEVVKLGGDGAVEIKESEHPAKMSMGKAKTIKAAHFGSKLGMGPTILFVA